MLHVLPRAGGVLDQPSGEILKLEKIMDAYTKYEDYEQKRAEARAKNKAKHT